MPPEHVDKDFSAFQSPHEASVDRLVQAVDRAYHRPFLMMWRAFLQGLMTAIGASVGTAIVVLVSIYVFKYSGGPGWLNNSIQKMKDNLLPKDLQTTSQPTPSPTISPEITVH